MNISQQQIRDNISQFFTHSYSLVCYSEGKLNQKLLCQNHFELAGQIVAECVGNSKEMLNPRSIFSLKSLQMQLSLVQCIFFLNLPFQNQFMLISPARVLSVKCNITSENTKKRTAKLRRCNRQVNFWSKSLGPKFLFRCFMDQIQFSCWLRFFRKDKENTGLLKVVAHQLSILNKEKYVKAPSSIVFSFQKLLISQTQSNGPRLSYSHV